MELNTMAFSSYMEQSRSRREQPQNHIETGCVLSFLPSRTEWHHWPASRVTKFRSKWRRFSWWLWLLSRGIKDERDLTRPGFRLGSPTTVNKYGLCVNFKLVRTKLIHVLERPCLLNQPFLREVSSPSYPRKLSWDVDGMAGVICPACLGWGGGGAILENWESFSMLFVHDCRCDPSVE